MADPAPTYAAWFQSLPIPWLVGGPVGSKDAAAQSALLDGQVARLKLAQKAHFPSYAPSDALPHIGGDRQLEQGPTETNANFVIRLKTAWDDWSRAGQPAELLAQLYWGGFPGAVLVQQNGLFYQLTAAPTAGVDPTPLLQIGALGGNASMGLYPVAGITISVVTGGVLGVAQFSITQGSLSTGLVTSAATSTWACPIPGSATMVVFAANTYVGSSVYTIDTAGNVAGFGGAVFPGASQTTHSWWTFDSNTAHGSRFAVLFPSGGPAFTTSGTAVFTGVEDGSTAHPWPTATWNNPFQDTTYKIQVGIPTVTDGAGAVVCNADNTTKTTTGVQIKASASFVGTVDVLAWEVGANPFADPHPNDLARLRRLINRWRPARALGMGVLVRAQGAQLGWPIRVLGVSGQTLGGSVLVFTV